MLTFAIFLLTLAILVVFHEFGHYIVARMFKVKIITFSLGFGPRLFTFKGRYNDWCISAIPLGGYVRMLDSREIEVLPHERHLAFNHKKPYQKILISFAGPAFNLLFAFVAYYFISIIGVTELKPVVLSVNQDLVQKYKFDIVAGSLINQINGIKVNSWQEADKTFNQQLKKSHVINFDIITHAKQQQNISIELNKATSDLGGNLYLENLGLYPFSYLPIIAYIEPDSVAMHAKLKINDEIIAINGKKVASWFDIVKVIQNSPSISINLQINRQGHILNIEMRPSLVNDDGQGVGKIGIIPTLNQKTLEENSYIHKYDILSAFLNASRSCYLVVTVNFVNMYAIISGHIAASNLGGPIAIAKASRSAFSHGVKDFIDFLALISIGLAIMNLLPIPVLDGGHILIYSIEWVIGREVSHSLQMLIFKFGFLLIIGVSIFAIYNDILRL